MKTLLRKINYILFTKPWSILIISILYIVFLQTISIAYCDMVGPLIDQLEESNSIVLQVVMNVDGSRTIITKDGG